MYFQRLRDLREDSDMNQTQIAEILFTSQTVKNILHIMLEKPQKRNIQNMQTQF